MFLSDAKIIKPYELGELSHELNTLYKTLMYDEDEDGEKILYFNKDIQLTESEYQELKDRFGHYILWVVNGNLILENSNFSRPAIIKGDLVCKSLMYNEYLKVKGKVTVKNYAAFIAKDHEMLQTTDPLILEARYVFSWFYDLKNVTLPGSTPVFIVCGGTDLKNMNLKNPYFYWKEWAFAMRPELCYAVDSNYSDALYWNFTAIDEALEKGEPLFIEGFDIAGMPLYREAYLLFNQKKYRESYQMAQQAAALSPGFYYPKFYMGYCLYCSSAFEQAIPVFEDALKLFPLKHKNLINRDAAYLAHSALYLEQPDLALKWSNDVIESVSGNRDDREILWHLFRVRGEAYLKKENLVMAKADLEKAVELNFEKGVTHWLLGLVFHKLGISKHAGKHWQIAAKINDKFDVSYEDYQDTSFLQPLISKVDWA